MGSGALFANGMLPEDAKRYNQWVALREVGLDQEKINDIILTNKGLRLDPSTYLSKNYIESHLKQFEDGVSIIQSEYAYNRFSLTNGFVGVPDDNSLFVLPKSLCDQISTSANGNISVWEKVLGFDDGYFANGGGLVRIDVDNIDDLHIRIPSGNEYGANSHWLPGGFTDGNVPEAITDTIPLSNAEITHLN